jgi:hypothetical protein
VKRSLITSLTLFVFVLGTLASAMAQSAKDIIRENARVLNMFMQLSKGFENALKTDDVSTAASVYGLERATANLLIATSRTRFKSVKQQNTMQSAVRAMMGRVFRLSERVQQHTIAELDRNLPGEPGRVLTADEHGTDLYKPLYRMGTPDPNKPAPTSEQAYKEMEQKFRDKGGTDADFHLLSTASLDGIPSGQLAEWVQFNDTDGNVRFTTAGAKHPVIGKGQPVRGAGSMKLYKDAKGQILLAIVSNSSGNYKPGNPSTEGVVNKMTLELGIPADRILVTSVIPEEPELIKLLLKSKKTFTDEQMKSTVASIRTRTAPPALQRTRSAKTTPAYKAPRPAPKAPKAPKLSTSASKVR